MIFGTALKNACNHDSDDDAMHLARAARIIRKDTFIRSSHLAVLFVSMTVFHSLYWLK